ncbi:tail assembly chaperone [Microbacterium phage Pumpernickel]|uniref:Tail assembly chaperone n=1 Tax=Microbacterium phage Pumpernickel TaxID=2885983 RepID=A0AAE8Y8A6_9CAUD|nr:tail assembly chaperone [Microbacterium phage Pumpernickel]UDL15883.1 tail assembly chaperone [Microbacterium phage Pumpernickel]
MASRFKDFGSPAADKTVPLTFRLYGEDFHAVPSIQGKTLMGLVAESSAEDPGESAKMVLGFFDKVLLAESLVRFNELIDSKDKIVPAETLAEIVGWLVEEYSGRPEEQRED